MRTLARRQRKRHLRRAGVAVQVAVMSTVIMGMGALAVDLGAIYTAQSELQVAADAAALAAAAQLSATGDYSVEEMARAAADEYARRNPVLGEFAGVTPGDVEFGTSVYDTNTQKYSFMPGGEHYDAVRVTVRRSEGSEGGPMALFFANIFGVSQTNLSARAAAVLIPRDIAVVIDLSNSMCWDSTLRYYQRVDGGFCNLRDVWCALDGPEPSRPYMPAFELDSEYADDTGPTFGEMNDWGDPLSNAYSISADPGLWYIGRNKTTTLAAAISALTARGYNSAERSALLSSSYDGTTAYYRNRVGVILGLAVWHSGKSGGLDPSGGDGDNRVEDFEMSWLAPPSFAQNWTWTHFIGWQRSGFTYRYGLKTLVDYALENRPQAYATDGLYATPEQPLRAVKDAVQTMIDAIEALDSMDHVSLEVFATGSRHELNLTDNLQSIPDRLYERQSGHYDTTTNIGGGLSRAIAELQSSRARHSTRKIIVLMSDGVPNVDEYGNYVGDGSPGAMSYARDMAQAAADDDMRIYTVSVGYYADRDLMMEIATIGGGQEFYAAGSPEEYTAELQAIFRTLGGRRPVALIE